MCTKLLAVHGLVFCRAFLEKIEIQREIFISQIEEGQQAFIPPDLSQSHLPFSFKYYDPILAIAKEKIARNRKEFFTLK
jgi:hypothetical protein